MPHSVIFGGGLREGVTRATAQANLARLFGLQDPARLDRYFSGAEVVIKAGLDAAQAEKYRQALLQAGLLAEVREAPAASQLLDIPPPPKPASQPLASPPPPPPPARAPAMPVAPITSPAPARPVATPPLPTPAGNPVRMWYVVRSNSEKLGPYTREEINAMAEAGQVTAADGIWKNGLKAPVAPGTLSWISLPDPASNMETRPAIAALKATGNFYRVPDSVYSAEKEEPAKKPSTIVSALVALLLVFNLRLGMVLASDEPSNTAYRVGYALGAVLFLPLLVMLICALWKGMRNMASMSKAFMFASLFVTVSLAVQSAQHEIAHFKQSTASSSGGSQGNSATPDAQGSSSADSNAISDTQLAVIVRAYNLSLPRMMDSATRMESVSLENRVITYTSTLVNITSTQVDIPGISAVIGAKIKTDACASKDMMQLMRQGVTYRYVYNSSDNVRLAETSVALADCSNTATR